MPPFRCQLVLVCAIVSLGALSGTAAPGEKAEKTIDQTKPAAVTDSPASAPYTTETLRGRVVWLAEAMKRRYGIDSDDDAAHSNIAIETTDGRLCPLVKDFNARGFWLDERLRAMEGEYVVRRYEKSPAVQLVRWYAVRQGRRYEVDYWCDICSIPMYELKTCDCCQGEIRLRERAVETTAP